MPALAILSKPSGGAWGFRTPGSPRVFLQLRQPRPRPGSPAPPRLGSVPSGRARLAGRQSPQLSPGCPCSHLASPPLRAPSSVTCALRGKPAILPEPTLSRRLRNPLAHARVTLRREELRPCTGRETRSETGGSYHLRGGTRKSAGSQQQGRRVVRVGAWSPSRHGRRESLWPGSRPRPVPRGVAPSCPPPPAAGPPRWYGPQPTFGAGPGPGPHVTAPASLAPRPPSPIPPQCSGASPTSGGLHGCRGGAEPRGGPGPREPAD